MMTADILNRISKGDEAAFSEVYNTYCNKVYSIAYSIVKDSFDAEDIMQEVFILLPQKLATLNNVKAFDSWLYRMTKNKALDFLRKYKPAVFSELSSEEDDYSFEDTIENENRDFQPEESLDYSETKQIVRNIIDSLPEEQRECVLLRFEKGLSLQEIADVTGTSLATVKSRLRYGKSKIEAAVREEEKKGTKLYGVSGLMLIPFLRWLFANGGSASSSLFTASSIGIAEAAVSAAASGAAISTGAATSAVTSTMSSASIGAAVASAAGGAAKAAASSAITKRIIAGVLSAVIAVTATVAVINPNNIVGSIFGVEQMSEVEKRIEDFEDAFNERDIAAVIDFFPPKFQQEFKMTYAIAQGLAGFVGVGDFFSDEMLNGVFGMALEDMYIDITVTDEKYNETKDRVVVTAEFWDGTANGTGEIKLVKIGKKWYLSEDYLQQ